MALRFKIVDNTEAIARVVELAKNIWNEHYFPMIGNGGKPGYVQNGTHCKVLLRYLR